MTGISVSHEDLSHHPLDIVEQLVDENDWVFDRRSDQEMAVQVPGRWCDYSMFIAWNDTADAVHFTCAFEMRVPESKRGPVHDLLATINERMWLGHFGIWDDEGLPMYRHAIPLRGTHGPSLGQMEDLINTAIMECERFYPAFQYVIWGGKTPEEAVAAAMIDPVGEA